MGWVASQSSYLTFGSCACDVQVEGSSMGDGKNNHSRRP